MFFNFYVFFFLFNIFELGSDKMAPKQQQQMDDLIARVEQLEHANTINLNKIAELEKDNGLLSERITKLEENSRSKVLDFSKLFDKKGTKSVEEINLTQRAHIQISNEILKLNKIFKFFPIKLH